jgi:hypothetical protein
MVVLRARSSRGAILQRLIPQRSTPQASAAEKCAWRSGAGAATRAATAASTKTRATIPVRRLGRFTARPFAQWKPRRVVERLPRDCAAGS